MPVVLMPMRNEIVPSGAWSVAWDMLYPCFSPSAMTSLHRSAEREATLSPIGSLDWFHLWVMEASASWCMRMTRSMSSRFFSNSEKEPTLAASLAAVR
ncbi:MAG: hypothetical protein BWY99_02173 [Synergistetes bacterium ADurb.BinA166]|nr:MAG: hypothetical protein BWY99_02173 [Synergistetes bacterium ADurb.BinA166]